MSDFWLCAAQNAVNPDGLTSILTKQNRKSNLKNRIRICRFRLFKQHKTELFYLDRDYKLKFLEEMSIITEAASKAFGADKMNCELLGNGDSHLHWHIFPRYKGDLIGYECGQKAGPVWWYPIEKMNSDEARPSDDELYRMKSALSNELDKLLALY